MFKRNILNLLDKWKSAENRKPLIIRGARQTGKTAAVEMFSKSFPNYIYLNLERDGDKQLFEKGRDLEDIISAIELAKKKALKEKNTLLFIDEIQNSQKALQMLRYFYEDYPDIYVIAAGSLLEAVMKREGFSFPVGRVNFLYLHPVTFDEFLSAIGEDRLLQHLKGVTRTSPPSPVIHEMAINIFHHYILVGGMPEVVAKYASNRTFQPLAKIKEELVESFEEDIAKYSTPAEAKYLRHVLRFAPNYVGERIKYENFANGGYKSREMKRAFDLLEYAMLITRVHGSSETSLPIKPNFNVAPKLLFLDSGLVVHKLGLTENELQVKDLNSLFRGAITEQIAGQTFYSANLDKKTAPFFWYRNAPGSTAETDYLFQFGGRLIPVEVKSGKSGRLRSLHRFMLASPNDMAIRLYSGELSEEIVTLENKKYELISVPFYLQWRLNELIK
ncbi:ATP-binding protein [bacterium]|nr:ATP-binding protein [bacterium]